MKKIIIVAGARPNFVKIAPIIHEIKKQKKKGNSHVIDDFKEDEEEKINEITENIVKQLPTLIQKKIDLFSSKVNQDLNGI